MDPFDIHLEIRWQACQCHVQRAFQHRQWNEATHKNLFQAGRCTLAIQLFEPNHNLSKKSLTSI